MLKILLYLIAFSLPAYLIRFNFFSIPTTLLEILIYLAIVIKIFEKKNLGWMKSKYNYPIILLIISGFISSIIAPDKFVALGLFKAYIIDPIFLFLLVKDLSKGEKVNLLKIFILSGIYVSAHAIWQYFSHNLTADNRVVGIFGYSPNYLAMYLCPIIVGLFAVIIAEFKKNKSWIIYLIVFLLSSIALLMSGSRASLVGAVVGIFFYLLLINWTKISRNKIYLVLLGIGIILMVILGYKLFAPNNTANPDVSGRISTSSNNRVEIWKTTFEIIKQKPILGVGLGNYQNYFSDLTKNRVNYPEYISPWALTPHNIFLTFWVNLGILGLVALIWTLAVFFKYSIRNKQIIAAVVIVAILVNGFFDVTYWKNDLSAIFWLFIGLI